jgi:hypothetical protein
MWGFIPSLNTHTTLEKHLPIATNHNTTTLLEKKNWVLSFLMIYLLSLSSTPLLHHPSNFNGTRKKTKQQPSMTRS